MPKRILPGAVILLVTGGCAFDVIYVDHTPVSLDAAGDSCSAPFTLSENVTFTSSGGYDRTLKPGTGRENADGGKRR